MKDNGNKPATTDAGIPLPSDEFSLTVGPDGPILLQDHYLIEQMANFSCLRPSPTFSCPILRSANEILAWDKPRFTCSRHCPTGTRWRRLRHSHAGATTCWRRLYGG
jgi:hypothetical protein